MEVVVVVVWVRLRGKLKSDGLLVGDDDVVEELRRWGFSSEEDEGGWSWVCWLRVRRRRRRKKKMAKMRIPAAARAAIAMPAFAPGERGVGCWVPVNAVLEEEESEMAVPEDEGEYDVGEVVDSGVMAVSVGFCDDAVVVTAAATSVAVVDAGGGLGSEVGLLPGTTVVGLGAEVAVPSQTPKSGWQSSPA